MPILIESMFSKLWGSTVEGCKNNSLRYHCAWTPCILKQTDWDRFASSAASTTCSIVLRLERESGGPLEKNN